MSRLVSFVFNTPCAIISFFIVSIWLAARPRSIAARRLALAISLFYLLASTYAISHAAAVVWNAGYRRVERSDLPSGRTAIILLGAGGELIHGWDRRFSAVTPTGMARVLEAYRVYKLIGPQALIISSGGLVQPNEEDRPSSETMRDALIGLGVPPDHIVVESGSRDTHDEAVAIAPMLGPLHVEQVVLVTSDIHMRRSIGTFKASGIDAVPAVAPESGSLMFSRTWLVPTEGGLRFSSYLMHELVGLPYYWARGWWRS